MPENAYRLAHLHAHRAAGAGPCRERAELDQDSPAGGRPCQALCTRCGRVTARRDGEGLAWCGGLLPGERTAAEVDLCREGFHDARGTCCAEGKREADEFGERLDRTTRAIANRTGGLGQPSAGGTVSQ